MITFAYASNYEFHGPFNDYLTNHSAEFHISFKVWNYP